MKKTALLAGFVALVAANAAMAEKSGFYVGADLGATYFNLNKSMFDNAVGDYITSYGAGVDSGTSSVDKHDMTFSVFVGYRFLPYLAAELAYIDLGQAHYKASTAISVVTEDGTSLGTADFKVRETSAGEALSVLGIWPVRPDLDAFVRVGAYYGETKVSADITSDLIPGESSSVSKRTTEVLYGIGADWHVADRWSLRLEFERIPNVGDKSTTGEANVDLYKVGAKYQF
ncbi:MAG TPA: outer membrane beta-barrel protein [Steroidobacteraceae bacterium]|nr:outer membrane beta-barrel protein [Steroidobacteraceae bacterium]